MKRAVKWAGLFLAIAVAALVLTVSLLMIVQALRSDSRYHGELLATLCLARNRAAIREAKPETFDCLFQIIDSFAAGHENRIASVNPPAILPPTPTAAVPSAEPKP